VYNETITLVVFHLEACLYNLFMDALTLLMTYI